MMHKRKKNSRQRGSKWCGWGQGSSHHKGSGSRGGVGRAGSGKRADQKKPSYWKVPTGKHGFKHKGIILKINAINISDLPRLISKGLLKEENGVYDLGKAGYNKLLGKGKAVGLKIKVLKASKNIIEDVKEAGGEVIVGEAKE